MFPHRHLGRLISSLLLTLMMTLPQSLPPQLPASTRTSIVSRTHKATILCWSSVVPGGPPHVSSSCFTVNGELLFFPVWQCCAAFGIVRQRTKRGWHAHRYLLPRRLPKKNDVKKVLNGIYIHSTVCITYVQYVCFESELLLSQFQSWLLIFIKGRPFIPCNLTQCNGRIS